MRFRSAIETLHHDGVYEFEIPPRPTMSPVPQKAWWRRLLCRHVRRLLYDEDLMFFQEKMGTASHYVCDRCGDTTIEEREG